MKPAGSLLYSPEPVTCPYPEPDWSSPCPPSHFSKIHITFHLLLGLASGLLPSGFPTKILCTSSFPHTCYMLCTSQSSWFDQVPRLRMRGTVPPLFRMTSWRDAKLIARETVSLLYMAHNKVCVVNFSFPFLFSMSLFSRNNLFLIFHSCLTHFQVCCDHCSVASWCARHAMHDVTEGSECGMTNSLSVGIDPMVRCICGSRLSYSVSIPPNRTDQYSSALGNELSSLAYEYTIFCPFLFGFPFLCYVRYQACDCLCCVFYCLTLLFQVFWLIASYWRPEWRYILGDILQRTCWHCFRDVTNSWETQLTPGLV